MVSAGTNSAHKVFFFVFLFFVPISDCVTLKHLFLLWDHFQPQNVLSKWSHNRKRCFKVTQSEIGTLSNLIFHAGSNKTGPKLIRPTVLEIYRFLGRFLVP